MAKITFTKKFLAEHTLPAGKNDLWAWDSDTAGLGLRLRRNATGVSSTWYLAYTIAGEDKRDPIGRFSDLTLDDARGIVQERRRELLKGKDPRKTARELHARAVTSKTLAEVIDLYLAQDKTRHNTHRAHVRYLRGEYFAPLHRHPIKEVTREQIATRLTYIENKGVIGGKPSANAASQARTALREVYSHALDNGWIERSHFDVIDGTRDPAPPCKHVGRDRILSDAELVEVWNAAPAIVRLLILTGCRREEIGRLNWSEINGDVCTLPAARVKNNQVRRVPLSPAVKAILTGIERVEGRDRVFSNSAWSYIKAKLPALDQPWTFHDLRRTFRTGLSRLHVFPHIAELCIGHKREKLEELYNQDREFDEQRAAFERWADYIDALVNGWPANVVPIRAA